MTIWDLFGGMALFIGPVVAIFSVAGSAIILVGNLINHIANRRRFRTGEQEFTWSVGGLLLGALMWMSLIITRQGAGQIGIVFAMSATAMGALLLLSLLLVATAFVVRKRNQARWWVERNDQRTVRTGRRGQASGYSAR